MKKKRLSPKEIFENVCMVGTLALIFGTAIGLYTGDKLALHLAAVCCLLLAADAFHDRMSKIIRSETGPAYWANEAFHWMAIVGFFVGLTGIITGRIAQHLLRSSSLRVGDECPCAAVQCCTKCETYHATHPIMAASVFAS
jgi:uncharacterized membrane protein YfcA